MSAQYDERCIPQRKVVVSFNSSSYAPFPLSISLWLNKNFKIEWQKEKDKKWKEKQQPYVFVFMFFLDSIHIINNFTLFRYYCLFGNLINRSDGNLPPLPLHTHTQTHSHTTRAQCLEVYSLIVKKKERNILHIFRFVFNSRFPVFFLFFVVFSHEILFGKVVKILMFELTLLFFYSFVLLLY